MFISYAHASAEHVESVAELWRLLCRNGVDARLDTPAALRRQDWPLWILEQIREADYVLVIASAEYRRRAEGLAPPDESRGVPFETTLIREALYADPVAAKEKYLPVLLPGGRIEDIPAFLGPTSTTHYEVTDFTMAGIQPLLRALIHQAEVEPYAGGELARRPDRHADLEPAVAGRPAAAGFGVPVPSYRLGRRVPPAELSRLIELLLEVPEIAGPARWQQLIDQLPAPVAHAIPRQTAVRAEAIALLRTCERYPQAWSALVAGLRLLAPESAAVRGFAAEVARLGLA